MRFREIQALIKKDLILEWRQRYALNGMLLYIGCTIFVCYLSFSLNHDQLSTVTWNALFWIIMLFAATNALAKSFLQEREQRQLYYYTLVNPQSIILSKIIYNTLLMLLLTCIAYFFYSLFLGNVVKDQLFFLISIGLGSMGFSIALTMVSGIAAKANNNSTLMPILGFPVILPIMLMAIKISKNAIEGLDRSQSYDEIITLLAINIIVGTVSFMLFPYIWRS